MFYIEKRGQSRVKPYSICELSVHHANARGDVEIHTNMARTFVSFLKSTCDLETENQVLTCRLKGLFWCFTSFGNGSHFRGVRRRARISWGISDRVSCAIGVGLQTKLLRGLKTSSPPSFDLNKFFELKNF